MSGGVRRGAPLLFRYAALRFTKGGNPRLWLLKGNSNCRSRERVIVAEHSMQPRGNAGCLKRLAKGTCLPCTTMPWSVKTKERRIAGYGMRQ